MEALVDFLKGAGVGAETGIAAVGNDIAGGEGETIALVESKASLVLESVDIICEIGLFLGSTVFRGTDSVEGVGTT